MPTYGYECKSCGHTFDAFQSMMDEPLKTCPECGREIRRLINGGNGVIFKGGGFYVTDKNGKSGVSGGKSNGKSGGTSAEGTKTTGEKSGTESAACRSCAASGGSQPESCPKAANS